MRNSDTLVIAVWTGLIFGWVEGLIFNASRTNPVLYAPYKLSSHVIWVTPVLDIIIFVSTIPILLLIANAIRRWRREYLSTIVYGWFLFLGYFALLSAPKLIHVVSAALLSLGLALATTKIIQIAGNKILKLLRRIFFLTPILILLSIGVVFGYERMHEARQAGRLPDSKSNAQNVLVIVMDTVRYDRFTSSYKSALDKSLTPYLDQVAAKGVRYENAWPSTSWTLPSQASILTGLYSHEHEADWPELKLNKNAVTLGEYFTQLGYATAAFSGNSSWVTPEYLGDGFMRFNVYTAHDFIRRTSYGRVIDKFLAKIGYHYSGLGKKAPQINAEFLRFLDDYPDNPFFVYICYMDVNQGFHRRQLGYGFWEHPPSVQEVIEAYDESLSVLDKQINDLFIDLESRGVLDNTLLIITSDHGESFGASGTEDHDPAGHGTSLYPEQSRVPLIIIYPRVISSNQRIYKTVSLRAIPTTITELLDLDNAPFYGDPLPVNQPLEISASGDSNHLLATLNYHKYRVQSVVWENWLYIKNLNNAQNNEELFNLENDPLAKTNLDTYPEIISSMSQQLDQLLSTNHLTDN